MATQLLHAAGIAFASKLREAPVVTVAYCDDEATTEPDFLEAIRFAGLHQLSVVFICEQDGTQPRTDTSFPPSCIEGLTLPAGLTHQQIDGSDVVTVYTAMRSAMQRARQERSPTLLEMHVTRSTPDVHMHPIQEGSHTILSCAKEYDDPLVRCKHYLQAQGAWDEAWAKQLCARLSSEVEGALQDAMRDTLPATETSRS